MWLLSQLNLGMPVWGLEKQTKNSTLNFTTKVTLCRIVIQQADDLLLCHSSFPGLCSVLANGTSLGAPDCKPHHNIYLKTVYTCIHKRHVHVLLSKFDIPRLYPDLLQIFSKIHFRVSFTNYQPFILHLDFWKSRSWEIKVFF